MVHGGEQKVDRDLRLGVLRFPVLIRPGGASGHISPGPSWLRKGCGISASGDAIARLDGSRGPEPDSRWQRDRF